MSILDWLVKPETLFAIGLFLLGVVVSVFSTDIRRFLSVPPRKWRGWRVSRMTYRSLLRFYPAYGSQQSLLRCLPESPINHRCTTLFLPASGGLASWIWQLRKIVGDLYHYEERVKYYEGEIRKLEPQVAITPVGKPG